jgi:hypothetical protein
MNVFSEFDSQEVRRMFNALDNDGKCGWLDDKLFSLDQGNYIYRFDIGAATVHLSRTKVRAFFSMKPKEYVYEYMKYQNHHPVHKNLFVAVAKQRLSKEGENLRYAEIRLVGDNVLSRASDRQIANMINRMKLNMVPVLTETAPRHGGNYLHEIVKGASFRLTEDMETFVRQLSSIASTQAMSKFQTVRTAKQVKYNSSEFVESFDASLMDLFCNKFGGNCQKPIRELLRRSKDVCLSFDAALKELLARVYKPRCRPADVVKSEFESFRMGTGMLASDPMIVRKCGGYQGAHRDLRSDQEPACVAFMATREDGMFLQLWVEGEPLGRICYIPFGVIVAIPKHFIHAGGITFARRKCSEPTRHPDLFNHRLHWYLFGKGAPATKPSNIYTENDDTGTLLSDYYKCGLEQQKVLKQLLEVPWVPDK